MNVLITVPHNVCLNDTENECDQTAKLSAEMLLQELRSTTAATVQCSVSSQHRRERDDNRPPPAASGALSPLQTWIQRWLKLHRHDSFVIDVHSFCPESESWSGLFDPEQHDIVLLLFGDYRDQSGVREFVERLTQQYERVVVVPMASNQNHIIMTARRHNVPAVLVEFSDTATESARSTAARAIARAIAAPSGERPRPPSRQDILRTAMLVLSEPNSLPHM